MKNIIKKIYMIVISALIFTSIAACGGSEQEEESYQIYYTNKDETKLVAVGYEPTSTDSYEIAGELLAKLGDNPEDISLKKIKPDDVDVVGYTFEERQVYVTFTSEYYELTNVQEIMLRAGVVRMLSKIPGVDYVSFYVDDQPLINSKGEVMGIMTADDFIENTGAQINAYDRNEYVLYFANSEGDKLIETAVELVYSSNISAEKLVIEQLIKGPEEEGVYPTISNTTKLISASTKDGICYVNFDEGFLKQPDGVIESVPVYSVVNTLLELPNISKVQIAVNGETNMVYKEAISLDTLFERNLDIIDKSN